VVSQELLDILRCPNCVRNGPEAGLLDHEGSWLICRDCDRKYPIRDDIPVMLIEEGDRFKDVPREELPEIPPPEERKPLAAAPLAPPLLDERQKLLLGVLGLAVGLAVIFVLVTLLRRRQANQE
jgi:uncharacterized protein YbaR (Trm112 family)